MTTAADRRRIPGPASSYAALPLSAYTSQSSPVPSTKRTRPALEARKLFIRTGLMTTAPGSAYIETSSPSTRLVVSIHGPRPLPSTSSYTPTLQLNITFSLPLFSGIHHPRNPPGPATQLERFLAIRLENLIKPMLLGHLFPKSGIDVNISVLEYTGIWNLLAIATNAVSAAIAEARIDVADLVSASSFALLDNGIVIDPSGDEEEKASFGGVVGYMASMGEITDVWIQGGMEVEDEDDMQVDEGHVRLGESLKKVIDAAADARLVVNHALMEHVKETGLIATEAT